MLPSKNFPLFSLSAGPFRSWTLIPALLVWAALAVYQPVLSLNPLSGIGPLPLSIAADAVFLFVVMNLFVSSFLSPDYSMVFRLFLAGMAGLAFFEALLGAVDLAFGQLFWGWILAGIHHLIIQKGRPG